MLLGRMGNLGRGGRGRRSRVRRRRRLRFERVPSLRKSWLIVLFSSRWLDSILRAFVILIWEGMQDWRTERRTRSLLLSGSLERACKKWKTVHSDPSFVLFPSIYVSIYLSISTSNVPWDSAWGRFSAYRRKRKAISRLSRFSFHPEKLSLILSRVEGRASERKDAREGKEKGKTKERERAHPQLTEGDLLV